MLSAEQVAWCRFPSQIKSAGLLVGGLLTAQLLLVISGCTMIPPYQRAPLPVASTYPRAFSRADAPMGSEIPWREFFQDERLKALISLALANNRDLRVAILKVEASRAEYRITKSASFPTVDGGGSLTRSKVSLSGFPNQLSTTRVPATFSSTQYSASIGITAYELDLWGRVRSLNRQALEQYLATEEARRSAQISLIAQVATEYFTFREAEEALAVSQETLEVAQASYKLNKAIFDAGAANELDVREAEAQVETARINILTYENQQEHGEDDLTLLIGQGLPQDLPAPRPFSDSGVLPQIEAGLPSELLERRPDILEAEHTLKAVNANIGAVRAAFFPTIALTGSIGSASPQLSQLFRPGTEVWSFSPQITLPIFNGGQNLANLDLAKINERIEVANYEKVIQTAFREVADALVAVATYSKQIGEETLLIGSEQRRYELANLRYRQGADTYLGVLTAQQDLQNAQQALLQAQLNKFASQISLYLALGGGWK